MHGTPHSLPLHDRNLSGLRVTVVGLGVEGQDLARFFATRGATVTISDAKPAAKLGPQLAAIADLDVRLSLGENRADAADAADLVVVSQGAPLDLPPIVRARERGIPISSRTKLFLELCRGTVVGISGSSGKTTTTSLVDAIFAASGRRSLVGGNIGGPLLSRLEEIDEATWVVLEVSHSQLLLTDRSPHVAALTNVTPNHLDRFTWQEYVELKRNLIAHQSPTDTAVLNLDNEVTRGFAATAAAAVVWFSRDAETPAHGAFLRGDRIVWRADGHDEEVMSVGDIPLRGLHNVENVLCAAALAGACGIDTAVTAASVRAFHAVPHRLELVGQLHGAAYYDDSIATSPERTLAGMRSFREPLVLLLGGRDKHLPLEELAAETARRCRAVVCFGEAGELLARACRAAHPYEVCAPILRQAGTLEEAVMVAAGLAQPGDVVLLSPACTSFDAYDNFEERGVAFRRLVAALGEAQEAPPA